MKFKPGDTVRYSKESSDRFGLAVYTVKSIVNDFTLVTKDNLQRTICLLELVEAAPEYEAGWQLNNGKAPIPEDAKVLKDDTGDIVAFKLVKRPVVKTYFRWAGKQFGQYATVGNPQINYSYKIIFTETDGVLTDVRLG